MSLPDALLDQVVEVVEESSPGIVARAAELLSRGTLFSQPELAGEIDSHIPVPASRERLKRLLRAWLKGSGGLDPAALAATLGCADRALERARDRQKVELLWTGPRARGVPLRRTDQALLELIGSAGKRLLVVSFAVYKVPAIWKALERACERGAVVDVVLESAEESGYRLSVDALAQLQELLGDRARFWVWPAAKRAATPNGRQGVLHAKCAAADGRQLFVSSANLTGHAMDLNMELGLLVTGGSLPGEVENHFDALQADGTLERFRVTTAAAVIPETLALDLAPPAWLEPEPAGWMRWPIRVCEFLPDGAGIRPVGWTDLGREFDPARQFVAPMPGSADGTYGLFSRCRPQDALPVSRSIVVMPAPTALAGSSPPKLWRYRYLELADADGAVRGGRLRLQPIDGAGDPAIELDLEFHELALCRPLAELSGPFTPREGTE